MSLNLKNFDVWRLHLWDSFSQMFPSVPAPIQTSLLTSLAWPIIEDERSLVEQAHAPVGSGPAAAVSNRSVWVWRPPDWYGKYVWYENLVKELDPKTYKQSMKSLNWEQLREAALKEYTCFIVKYMWWLVPRLARQKIIHCKWIFNTKLNVDESLEKLKARLVALGFSWIKGIYFNEVFSATSPQESFRILLSVMENKGRSGQSLDIRGSLLNRNLNKKIYMTQPEGFVRPEKPDGVCEIIRSLYGLKKNLPTIGTKSSMNFS